MLGGALVQTSDCASAEELSLIEPLPASIQTDPEFHPLLLAAIALSPVACAIGLAFAFLAIF